MSKVGLTHNTFEQICKKICKSHLTAGHKLPLASGLQKLPTARNT